MADYTTAVHTKTNYALCSSYGYCYLSLYTLQALSLPPYTRILSAIHWPKERKHKITKNLRKLSDCIIYFNFYRFCDNIVIMNSDIMTENSCNVVAENTLVGW